MTDSARKGVPPLPPDEPGASAVSGRSRALQFVGAFGPFIGLAFIVLLLLVYDLAPDGELEKFSRLFKLDSVKNIIRQSTSLGIGALGMTVIIISGGIDLSPGSAIALVTVVIALCLDRPVDGSEPATGPLLALAAGLGTGVAIGFVNGLVITRFRIVPFIVTLGMMSVARGLAKLFSGEQKITVDESWVSGLLQPEFGTPIWDHPPGVWILVGLAILLWVVLRYTVFGRYVFAIGSKEETAVLCGIRVARQKIVIYALGGFFVGIAAILDFSQLNSGDPSAGIAKELDIIAAVVIGGGSLSGGKGSVLGTLIGAFIIGLLRASGVLYDISTTVQEVAIGAIIVSAAAIDRLQAGRKG